MPTETNQNFLESRTFDEIHPGESASLTRTLRAEDIQLFAIMSGDINPAIVERHYQTRAIRRIGEAFECDGDRKALVVMATGEATAAIVDGLVALGHD